MSKADEIDYIKQVAKVEGVPEEDFRKYLLGKPFSDPRCGEYLMDIAQVMRLLPQPPARLLDLGVGSGWTSAIFAERGYDVLGLDISPDMIDLAKQRSTRARFDVSDYEVGPIAGQFDIAIIYDALHHADDGGRVVSNAFEALAEGGMLVTVEPGAGHSTSPDSIAVMAKYGTTEKDMPFSLQREMMLRAGFTRIEQYTRVSQLPTEDISSLQGSLRQLRHGFSIGYGSATGLTSIVLARKIAGARSALPGDTISKALLGATAAHDDFVGRQKFPGNSED